MENKTVSELRELCRQSGLPVSGNKARLVRRLNGKGRPPPSQYDNMTMNELKKLCKEKNISTSGVKDDLIWDLLEHKHEVVTIPVFIKMKRKLTYFLSYTKEPNKDVKVKIANYFEVRNAVNTSVDKHVSSSWIKFWSDKTGKTPTTCSIHGCNANATVGGHLVYKYNQRRHYISPICYEHNSKKFDTHYSVLKQGSLVVSISKYKYRDGPLSS